MKSITSKHTSYFYSTLSTTWYLNTQIYTNGLDYSTALNSNKQTIYWKQLYITAVKNKKNTHFEMRWKWVKKCVDSVHGIHTIYLLFFFIKSFAGCTQKAATTSKAWEYLRIVFFSQCFHCLKKIHSSYTIKLTMGGWLTCFGFHFNCGCNIIPIVMMAGDNG